MISEDAAAAAVDHYSLAGSRMYRARSLDPLSAASRAAPKPIVGTDDCGDGSPLLNHGPSHRPRDTPRTRSQDRTHSDELEEDEEGEGEAEAGGGGEEGGEEEGEEEGGEGGGGGGGGGGEEDTSTHPAAVCRCTSSFRLASGCRYTRSVLRSAASGSARYACEENGSFFG